MPTHAQSVSDADNSAARILAYFTIGRDDAPQRNVTLDQFKTHMNILKQGDYNVLPLGDIIARYKSGESLPDKVVALTFDGGDKSVLDHATPLLEDYGFPYTVFMASARADADDPRYLNWDDLRKMRQSTLMDIGLHSEIYGDIYNQSEEYQRQKLNNASYRLREKMQYKPKLFAYPFGEYTDEYKRLIQSYNFNGAVGQNSGVASLNSDPFALPRFTMTEDYADAERFNMVINALPLPVSEVTPKASIIDARTPAIGFTVDEGLKTQIKALSCFASGQEKPELITLGNRVELRLNAPIESDRFRVNCTLPVRTENEDKTISWRWLGLLMRYNDAD